MKQTAVQELIKQIQDRINLIPDDPGLSERGMENAYVNCLRWAEECLVMEKEQIMQALNDGKAMAVGNRENISLEQYYNETYGVAND